MALFDRTISVEEFEEKIDADELISIFKAFGLITDENDANDQQI